jgi:hypothetical protein
MSEYKPDETKSHLMYVIEARKNSPHDKCLDQVTAKVHSKEECDQLVAYLKKGGYLLQVNRASSTLIVDDPFPEDDDEEE